MIGSRWGKCSTGVQVWSMGGKRRSRAQWGADLEERAEGLRDVERTTNMAKRG